MWQTWVVLTQWLLLVESFCLLASCRRPCTCSTLCCHNVYGSEM